MYEHNNQAHPCWNEHCAASLQTSSVVGALARIAMSQIETFQKQFIVMLAESQDDDAQPVGTGRDRIGQAA